MCWNLIITAILILAWLKDAAAYTCADGSPFMNQTCFNCDVPAANTSCDVPRYYQYTLEQCQIAVDGTIVYMSEFQIDKLHCKRYSCFLDELDIFSFRPLRALTKPTCISDCQIFQLLEYTNKKVSATPNKEIIATIGECVHYCFEFAGCYTFAYGNGICKIYTDCGFSCDLVYSASSTAYKRNCSIPHTECYKLLGSLTFNVSVPSPRSVGAVAEYTCEVGYQLTNGSTQRTCLDSLSWDGTWPTCTKVNCPLTFHTVCYNCDIVDGSCLFVNTSATFDECRAAAMSNNSMFVDYNTTICKTFSCQIPTIIYTAGSVALFSSCSQECPRFTLEKIVGFKVNDSVPINKTFIANHIGECFLSCLDRPDCLTFTFENITHNCKVYTACGTGCLSSVASGVTTYKRHCFTECDPLYNTTSEIVYVDTVRNVGTVAEYRCNHGYKSDSEPLNVTCTGSLFWSGPALNCSLVDCGQPLIPTNGTVSVTNGTLFGAEIYFGCDTGFRLNGNASSFCQDSGKWDAETPKCQLIDCGPLAPPSWGNVQLVNSTTSLGSMARYSCHPGYRLSTSVTRVCTENSNWSENAPICVQYDNRKFAPLYIMPCACVAHKQWGNWTQPEILVYLTKELLVPKNATSLAKNKLISRSDPRQSSTNLGIVGLALIFGMIGLLFLSDLPYLILNIRATWTGRPDLIRQLERKALKKKHKNKKPTKLMQTATDAKKVK